jgi:predicted branched-subunit amino acid permease
MKLTENQFKWAQILLGIAAGGGMWISIWGSTALATYFNQEAWGYMFVAVFLVVILVQRRVEKKLGVPLKLYFKSFLISLVVGLGVFILIGVAAGETFFTK